MYLTDKLKGLRCQLFTQAEIASYALLNYALDCDYHRHVKRQMLQDLTAEIAGKTRFTSEEHHPDTPNMYGSTRLRAEVYVLSPDDVRELAQEVETTLLYKDARIGQLELAITEAQMALKRATPFTKK